MRRKKTRTPRIVKIKMTIKHNIIILDTHTRIYNII